MPIMTVVKIMSAKIDKNIHISATVPQKLTKIAKTLQYLRHQYWWLIIILYNDRGFYTKQHSKFDSSLP